MNWTSFPVLGQIVICQYGKHLKPPEMVKDRLAVVMNTRLPKRDKLCTVVPLSTTASLSGILYQCKIELPYSVCEAFAGTLKWAKADMLATVALDRLILPYDRPQYASARIYKTVILPADQIIKVQKAMLHALSLGHLTPHL